jgi:flagellar hook protein FlgE
MSIYTALRAGVSGLTSHASALATISDNIANVNTVAYKRATTDFSALINGQNAATSYNAGGVVASARRLVDIQGSLEQSRSTTDLAISGNGFFVVSEDANALAEGGAALYTRAGSFSVDANGFLANAQGNFLQGWEVANDGTVVTSPTSLSALSAVNIADVGGAAEATENVTVNGNLKASEDIYDGTLVPYAVGSLATNAINPHYQTTLEVFDSVGSARTVVLGFLKTAASTWQVEVYARPQTDAPANPGGRLAEGVLVFDSDGSIQSFTGSASGPVNVTWAGDVGAGPQTIEFDLESGMSQFAAAFGVTSVTTDGVPAGDLQSLVMEENGFLTAQFTNGRTRAIYQIPVATFLNANGLLADQEGIFRTTLASGNATMNAPGAGSAGDIRAGVLEGSNVDLATEFTQMITTQRAYSASSKIITTADEMLEELIRIKR